MLDDLLTTSQIADELDVSIHRVVYAIKTRGIEPIRRAGIVRLFGRDQVDDIKLAMGFALLNRTSKWHPQYNELAEQLEQHEASTVG